jgi:hypothetical protein
MTLDGLLDLVMDLDDASDAIRRWVAGLAMRADLAIAPEVVRGAVTYLMTPRPPIKEVA